MLSIVPPGRTTLIFSYTLIDLGESYNPPTLSPAASSIFYTYNATTGKISAITAPSGDILAFAFDDRLPQPTLLAALSLETLARAARITNLANF